MKLGNQYIIPFKGLKDGDHDFEFGFEQKFFDEHEVLEARHGNLKARVLLTKKTTMLTLDIDLKGTLNIQCNRCLEYYDQEIRHYSNLIIKFGENTEESTDEIWVIDPNEHEVNMEQYLFECLGLSLPIQRIHPDDEEGFSTCDPDMLEKLEQLSSHGKTEEDIDPRWNALKKLLNDTNNN